MSRDELARIDAEDRAEYDETVQQIILVGKLAADLDTAGVVNTINHTESVGYILDPSLMMAAGNRVRAVKRLASALIPFQEAFREFQSTLLSTQDRERLGAQTHRRLTDPEQSKNE